MDIQLLLWFNQGWANAYMDALMTWVSSKQSFSFPLLLLLLIYSIRQLGTTAGWAFWLALGVTIGIGDILGNYLKDLLLQPRPCFDIFWLLRDQQQCGSHLTGMPSNHAINFFAATTFVTLTTRWRQWQIMLWLAAILVAISRIYLGKHYPSQVLTGLFIGSLVGFIGAWLACRWQFCAVEKIDHPPFIHHSP